MKTPKLRWIATKHFEATNPNRSNPDTLAGELFFTKAEATAFAKVENRRHSSGYVVLKLNTPR